MAFCKNCGKELDPNQSACSACGTAVNAETQSSNVDVKQMADDVVAMAKNLNDTPDTTAEYDAADISANRVMAILAYISLLFLVPIFAAPNSKFARFHANQGILIFAVGLAYGVVTGTVMVILGAIFWSAPAVIAIFGVLFGIGGLVPTAGMVLGIVNAARGKAKELPIIGKYRVLK